MSREIKFRAWLERKQEMLTPYFFVNDENFITQYGSGKPDSVMQYTGLKDKYGKEIYEGDIAKLKKRLWPDGREWESVELVENLTTNQFDGEIGGGQEYEVSVLEIEVVGNMYENPDLLTGMTNK